MRRMESLDIYGVYAEILWAEARIARLEEMVREQGR